MSMRLGSLEVETACSSRSSRSSSVERRRIIGARDPISPMLFLDKAAETGAPPVVLAMLVKELWRRGPGRRRDTDVLFAETSVVAEFSWGYGDRDE